jgi:hypothetical protein
VSLLSSFTLYGINNRECEVGYVTRVEKSVFVTPEQRVEDLPRRRLCVTGEKKKELTQN